MNSEKVKEIKKALEYAIDMGLVMGENTMFVSIKLADILTLINELESENAKLLKENESLNGSWKNAVKRIAELEETNKKLKQSNKNILFVNEQVIKRNEELEKEKTEQLKQFAERLKDRLRYTSPTSDVLELSGLEFDGVEVEQCIDEILKEFIND